MLILLLRRACQALVSQRDFRIAHRERRVRHVLPEFTFSQGGRFLIPCHRRYLPRGARLAVHRDAQHHKIAVTKWGVASVERDRFYFAALRGYDGHVARRSSAQLQMVDRGVSRARDVGGEFCAFVQP